MLGGKQGVGFFEIFSYLVLSDELIVEDISECFERRFCIWWIRSGV